VITDQVRKNSYSFYYACSLLFRIDTATNQNDKALIKNFWTMALGNFNKKIIEKINYALQGSLVNIEKPEDLVEAYAQIAEIL
jgi:hypothetical protein